MLLPVWGANYVDQFLAFGLPSLLAAGNLPALAATLPTRFVLLAPRADSTRIVRNPGWDALRAVAAVDVIPIDDLISDSTSTVLSLAYARGLHASGAKLTDTAFIFLVSDYLVADGSLVALLRRIDNGAGAVLTGNLTANAEAVAEALAPSRNGEPLAVVPRALMRLALDHLHLRSKVGLVGESELHDADANRLFWRAGADALIGRFYLLHMAAIRPEVDKFIVAAPCDYGLVDELVPNGRVETITDSDEYAVIELTAASSDAKAKAAGAPSTAAVASSVQRWATARQRRNAATPILFHAAGSPDATAVVEVSARFVAQVAAQMTSEPMPSRHHPLWTGQLVHHSRTAVHPNNPVATAELLGYDPAISRTPYRPGLLRSRLLGYTPDVRPWHPRWPDLVALRRVLKEFGQDSRVVVTGEATGVLRDFAVGATVLSLADLDEASDANPATFDFALLAAGDAAQREQDALADRMWNLLKPTGVLAVSVGAVFTDGIEELRGKGSLSSARSDVRAVPYGPARAAVQTAMMAHAARAGRRSGMALVVTLVPLAFLALASILLNVTALLLPAARNSQFSSAIAVFRRAPAVPGTADNPSRAPPTVSGSTKQRASFPRYEEGIAG